VLHYTGGTTGVSKGAMLNHRNLLSNLNQVRDALGDTLEDGREIIVAPLPIYHIFAFMLCMLLGVDIGARVILIPDPRNQPQFIRALKGVRFTFFAGLNTLFNALCRNEDFRKLDFSGLHVTVSGGMALMKDTAERWEAVTGCKVIEGYGLTEASPVVALNPPRAPRLGTVGLLMPGTHCRLVDSEGNDVPPGAPGELLVKGPQVMKGYWRRPRETAEILDAKGWLHTGDVAVIDEQGYLSIVDRIKDMIVVSGFNVYPNEVEDVISTHPEVVECAAVGVPDEDTVEAVKLFVVSANPALTADDIRQFARQQLTGYKIPRDVAFVEELPKSNVGKVLRKELRGK
jgi:long-chain acyl-CoA synthetase